MKKIELFLDLNNHLIEDERPSLFSEEMFLKGRLSEHPFTMISDLKRIKQTPKHHPEGNVWNHTMLVIDEAAKKRSKSSDARAFMWAALLHDIGKAPTSKKQGGKITAYNHDKAGSVMAKEFFSYFNQDETFINKVVSLVRWHMQILFVVNNRPFADIESMKKEADIHEVALLGLCDRMGRLGANAEKEEDNIKKFVSIVSGAQKH